MAVIWGPHGAGRVQNHASIMFGEEKRVRNPPAKAGQLVVEELLYLYKNDASLSNYISVNKST